MPRATSRLKELLLQRKAEGITQRAIAAASGISESTLGNIANKGYETTKETLTRIAKALEVDFKEIYETEAIRKVEAIAAAANASVAAANLANPNPTPAPTTRREGRIYHLKLQIRQMSESFDAYPEEERPEVARDIAQCAMELAEWLGAPKDAVSVPSRPSVDIPQKKVGFQQVSFQRTVLAKIDRLTEEIARHDLGVVKPKTQVA